MESERLAFLFSTIFTKDQLNRITIIDDESLTVVVDLHRLSKIEAKRFVSNLINLTNNHPFSLDLIHGYHRGTVLKEMIADELKNKRIVANVPDATNLGVTHLVLA